MTRIQSTGVADFDQYGEERAPDRRAKCTATPQARHLRRFISILIGLCASVLVFQGNDIRLFLNAARDVVAGANPYHVPNLINPIVVPLLFVPISFLPDLIVLRFVAFLSVTIYSYIILREARHWFMALILICSPMFLYNVYYANLDWLSFAALLVSPVPAFFLALVKPQIGAGIALIALLIVWQKSKPLAMLMLVAEVIIYGASYALGMRWQYAYTHGNFSIFPYGLVLGVPLLLLCLHRRDAVIALAAMPFLSPYVGPQSWIAVLPLLARIRVAPVSKLSR